LFRFLRPLYISADPIGADAEKAQEVLIVPGSGMMRMFQPPLAVLFQAVALADAGACIFVQMQVEGMMCSIPPHRMRLA